MVYPAGEKGNVCMVTHLVNWEVILRKAIFWLKQELDH